MRSPAGIHDAGSKYETDKAVEAAEFDAKRDAQLKTGRHTDTPLVDFVERRSKPRDVFAEAVVTDFDYEPQDAAPYDDNEEY